MKVLLALLILLSFSSCETSAASKEATVESLDLTMTNKANVKVEIIGSSQVKTGKRAKFFHSKTPKRTKESWSIRKIGGETVYKSTRSSISYRFKTSGTYIVTLQIRGRKSYSISKKVSVFPSAK